MSFYSFPICTDELGLSLRIQGIGIYCKNKLITDVYKKGKKVKVNLMTVVGDGRKS